MGIFQDFIFKIVMKMNIFVFFLGRSSFFPIFVANNCIT